MLSSIATIVNFLLKCKAYRINGKQDEAILFSRTRFNQCQHLALRSEGQRESIEGSVGKWIRENAEGH